MAAGSLWLVSSKLSTFYEKRVYFPNSFSIHPEIKTYRTDLEALAAVPASHKIRAMGYGVWLGLYSPLPQASPPVSPP